MYAIGIDVGGTFTDLVAVDAAGKVTLAKSSSTPGDQSVGVMEGLERLAEALLTVSRPISISGVLRPRTCNARSATTNVSSVSLPDNGVVAAENW